MDIIVFLQGFSSPFWDAFFQRVTILGEEYFYIVMLALVFWCVDKRYGYKLSFAFLLSGVLNNAVKSVVRAKRPIGVDGIRSLRVETATGTSFPSGHTQSVAAFMVSLMKQLRRWWVIALGSIIILFVAVSRLYLGVHWPLDVAGGIVLGTASVFLADFAFERFLRAERAWIPPLLILPAVAACCLWSDSEDLIKTAATFCGFLAGYAVESRLIRFESRAPLWKQAVKFALGIAVALAIKEGLKLAFPEKAIFDFLRYLILGLWVTVGAPIIFRALRLANRT